MVDFIKKNIFIVILFIITLSIGFLTFLTFIDKSFIRLSDQNLQLLLIFNTVLLIVLFFAYEFTIAILVSAMVFTLVSGLFFGRKIGGITGDSLGAANQLVEVTTYLVLAGILSR